MKSTKIKYRKRSVIQKIQKTNKHADYIGDITHFGDGATNLAYKLDVHFK